MNPIEFAISTPDENLQAHIDHALSLSLPEADHHDQRLTLIANGPSARHWRSKNFAQTMAINGALSLFTESGAWPTYWIACDPQEHVIDFLKEAPIDTTYLVASKCHPSVFKRLKGYDVRLWHVNDIPIPNHRQIPCAVSVTICALLLAGRLGYRTIDVWGWDCCFDGEAHHGGQSLLSATSQRIEIEVMSDPPQVFTSNPTWACEVNDAKGVLPVLRWCGVDVRVHGRSMLSAILPEYAGC